MTPDDHYKSPEMVTTAQKAVSIARAWLYAQGEHERMVHLGELVALVGGEHLPLVILAVDHGS